jgi:hypothetical protein
MFAHLWRFGVAQADRISFEGSVEGVSEIKNKIAMPLKQRISMMIRA